MRQDKLKAHNQKHEKVPQILDPVVPHLQLQDIIQEPVVPSVVPQDITPEVPSEVPIYDFLYDKYENGHNVWQPMIDSIGNYYFMKTNLDQLY